MSLKNVIFVAYSFMFTIKRTLVSLFYIYLYFFLYIFELDFIKAQENLKRLNSFNKNGNLVRV